MILNQRHTQCMLTDVWMSKKRSRKTAPPHADSIQYKETLPCGYVTAVTLIAFRFLGQLITMFAPARYYKLKKKLQFSMISFQQFKFFECQNHNFLFSTFIWMPRSLYRPGQSQRSSPSSYAPAWLLLHALGSAAATAHREAALSCTLCCEVQWYLVKDTEVEASVKENVWTVRQAVTRN